jgi:hypothetical protein
MTSTGPLLLRMTIAMSGCHQQPVANVINIYIAPFQSSTHKYLNYMHQIIFYM